MTAPFDVLKKGFAALHLSEEHADCKLICGPYHFNLHKAVVTSQSDYFKAAFKKGRFSEGNTSTIELKYIKNDAEGRDDEFYDDPEIVKLMVHYFYHFDYPSETQSTQAEDLERLRKRLDDLKAKEGQKTTVSQFPPAKPQNFLLGHVKVFAMAVKYQVEGLRHLAASKFWHETKEAISMIYSSTPDGVTELRASAQEILHKHFEELKHKKGIEEVMCKHPSLMYALLGRKNRTASPSEANLPAAGGNHNRLCQYCNLRQVEDGVHPADRCERCFRDRYGMQTRRARY